MAAQVDSDAQTLGLRALLPAFAQCEGLFLESKTGVPALPGTRTEPAHSASTANQARLPGRAGCAHRAESGLVNVLYERPAGEWQVAAHLQRDRRLQP